MLEFSSSPGDDRCLAGLCAALESSRSEPPERVLAGFAEAMMVELAAFLQLRDGLADLRAATRERRLTIDGALHLPGAWATALAEGRMVRGSAADLGPGERATLRLAPTSAVLVAPVPASEGPPAAAVLLATSQGPRTWSSSQEQALRGLVAGLAGWSEARRWQQIVDHLPQQVAWKDAGLRYRGANRAFTRGADLTLPQLVGRVDAELPWPAGSVALAQRREQLALTTPQIRHLEVVSTAGGREQWFEVSRIPLEGGLLVVRDDVSARVQLSQQLQLALRVAAIGRLAAGIGEELPAIASEISAVVAAAHTDPAAREHIDRHTRNLEDLARQLATFARRQLYEPVELVPGQVLTRMEPSLTRLLGEPLRLALAPPALRCAVRVDPRLFELLLVSLLMHLRSRLGRGCVTLEVAPETLDAAHALGLALPTGEYVRLRVQAEPADPGALRQEDAALDLRLALAHTIAAQAGGRLHVAPDRLRLELHLPRVFTPPRPPDPRPVVDLRGAEALLVIEDDPTLAQTLAVVLRHLGYDVFSAPDLPAALHLLDLPQGTCPPGQVAKTRISLALLSTALPDAGEALRRLRVRDPELRVLWLTTTPGSAALATDPLVVPCTFEALALRVRQALESRGT